VDDNNYRVYITIAGSRIAGAENHRDDQFITIRGAAYMEMDPSQTRVNFHAIPMVEPEKPLPIRVQALLTDIPMAPMIEERFRLYLEQLDLEARKRQLDKGD